MRTALLVTAAFAAATCTTVPVMAQTWITYHAPWEPAPITDRFWAFQIDAGSIAKHNGWVYANHRGCPSYDRFKRLPCSHDRFSGIAAQCRQGVLEYPDGALTLRYTRRNRNEWWLPTSIRDGSRYTYAKGWSEEDLKELRDRNVRVDKKHDAAFKFLCG